MPNQLLPANFLSLTQKNLNVYVLLLNKMPYKQIEKENGAS